MTPENLAKAAELHTQLSNAQSLLGRLQDAQRRGSKVELNMSFTSRPTDRGGPLLDRETASTIIQNLIDTTKDELRALGVVFEPEDAVMPEIRDSQDQWGAEIEVHGVRPDWLRDDEQAVKVSNLIGTEVDCLRLASDKSTYWANVSRFRLPADHPYYTAIEKGFTYWPGGDRAPDDWDGGDVLLENGNTSDYRHAEALGWMLKRRQEAAASKGQLHYVIGYKPRVTAPERPFTDDVDPASREPKTPDHLTITLTGPQGCGKTVVANWLFGAVAYWNGNEDADAAQRFISLESAFKGKPVTIIDGSDR